MSERYFAPDEVARLIPRLAPVMERLMHAHAESGTLRERLREEQAHITLAGGGVVDQAAWRARGERLAALARAAEAGVREILALGGVPKDLALGLVDFPHLREGTVVNLCWKYGEQEIRYWHGQDEGYAGRRPL